MNTEMVLLFHMNIFRAAQLKQALNLAGYAARICSEADEKCRLKDLFKNPVNDSEEVRSTKKDTCAAEPSAAMTEELIVLGTFSGEDQDRILALLRQNGAGSTLKAVLTNTNGFWTVSQLFKELQKERAGIEMYRRGKGKQNT